MKDVKAWFGKHGWILLILGLTAVFITLIASQGRRRRDDVSDTPNTLDRGGELLPTRPSSEIDFSGETLSPPIIYVPEPDGNIFNLPDGTVWTIPDELVPINPDDPSAVARAEQGLTFARNYKGSVTVTWDIHIPYSAEQRILRGEQDPILTGYTIPIDVFWQDAFLMELPLDRVRKPASAPWGVRTAWDLERLYADHFLEAVAKQYAAGYGFWDYDSRMFQAGVNPANLPYGPGGALTEDMLRYRYGSYYTSGEYSKRKFILLDQHINDDEITSHLRLTRDDRYGLFFANTDFFPTLLHERVPWIEAAIIYEVCVLPFSKAYYNAAGSTMMYYRQLRTQFYDRWKPFIEIAPGTPLELTFMWREMGYQLVGALGGY